MDTQIRPKVTPKDFFLWLGAMAALYVSVISLLTLYFQYINNLFPDSLNSYVDPYSSAIRFSIASLIVATPLYIYLTRKLNAEIRVTPEKKELWVRRWIIYITLFVGGLTLAIDMVALINTFLGGDLTTRFILKVISVFLVVYAFFWYYLADLRGRWEKEVWMAHILGWLMGAVVIVSVVGGFFIIGSPFDQRLYRFDEQKVSDLNNIQWQVVNYYQQKGKVPASLLDLQDPISGFVVPVDPETKLPYTYTVSGTTSFSLCATFNKASRNNGTQYMTRPASPATDVGSVGTDLASSPFDHGVGEKCFARTIDPERYPLYKK